MAAPDLRKALEAQLNAEQLAWLDDSSALSGERFLACFVGAGRRLGIGDCALEDAGVDGKPWSLRLAGRVHLLMQLDHGQGSSAEQWIERAYREGDSREKAAVMSALPHLSGGTNYKAMALDAGRSNEAALFASVALHNAYPATSYSEAEFNQLVMKAAFQDLDLGQICGLQERANAELARMGMDYIDERLAATRPYPSSLWLAIAPHSPPGAVARMVGELHHSQTQRRLGAVRGLSLCRDERALVFLRERLAIESFAELRQAMQESLAALEGSSNETV